jgi:hypothetical protein
MFGAATLFGTASTGTAIGTLSGAAFSSAALAWLGGSVVVGTGLVFVIPLITGVAAWVGTKKAWKKWFVGEPRPSESLSKQEAQVISAIDFILLSLCRDQNEEILPECVYYTLWKDSISPIIDFADTSLESDYAEWPRYARRRIRRATSILKNLKKRSASQLATTVSIPIGLFGATIMQNLSGNYDYTAEQQRVIDAFRRSSEGLSNATPSEISTYLADMGPDARRGTLANVKGIYHEIEYAHIENHDDDAWRAELMIDVNHPGSDILKFNTETGAVRKIQLKATDNPELLARHQARYEDIDAEVTAELAAATGATSSGILNEDLTASVAGAVREIELQESAAGELEHLLEVGFIASVISFSVSFGGSMIARKSLADAGEDAVQSAGGSLKWAIGSYALAEIFL